MSVVVGVLPCNRALNAKCKTERTLIQAKEIPRYASLVRISLSSFSARY